MTLLQLEILVLRTRDALRREGSHHGAHALSVLADVIHAYEQGERENQCQHETATAGPKSQCLRCGAHMGGLRT